MMVKQITPFLVLALPLLLPLSWHSAWAFQSPLPSLSRPFSIPKSTNEDNILGSRNILPNVHTTLSSSKDDFAGSTATAYETDDILTATDEPQVLASGFSQNMDMVEALKEAVEMALASLPAPIENKGIDLAVVSVSSLYDGNASPSLVVPTILATASSYGTGVQNIVGSTCGGFIGSTRSFADDVHKEEDEHDSNDAKVGEKTKIAPSCLPTEREGVPGVSIVLCLLPDVQVRTFHVIGDDVPDDYEKMSSGSWKSSIGLLDSYNNDERDDREPAVMVFPSPAMSNELDDFLRGMEFHLPGCNLFGSVASTVSSLSRARLFRYDAKMDQSGDSVVQTLADGCVGVVMEGDIAVNNMIAQGAKPVGGVYNIVKGEASTIFAVALDESATDIVRAAEQLEEEDEDDENYGLEQTMAAKMAAAYAKARIPKPVLAEANFVMKTLSDDDQAFMKKYILVGLERSGARGRTTSELARLAEGRGHGYAVHQVASASMKDGSVTLSLGSVDIEQGTHMRFFVRESDFAKKEVEALLTGYKKRSLEPTPAQQDGDVPPQFQPTGCLVFPTLDRGSKFFFGKQGFESSTLSDFLPAVPCVAGFFGNGVIGSMSPDPSMSAVREPASMNGSASGYFLIGSKTNRPIYRPKRLYEAKVEEETKDEEKELELAAKDEANQEKMKSFDLEEKKAPRDERGELILKRREVHSGRAMLVSTVEWSVAENMATPTSSLEGFMWDKETEVDRFRERVPLANLLSQCKLFAVDPSKPKPRDWIGPVKKAASEKGFVIVPDCKRTEPETGSLRKRYDVSKLVKDFTMKGTPAISVNCDPVLFGGSLEDLTKAREASSKAAVELSSADGVNAPPILASDLLLYPYQLYKMRLAGADAVNLIVGALANKDLVYLTKIASSLNMQAMLTVTSAAQVDNLKVLSANSIDGLIISNRDVSQFNTKSKGESFVNFSYFPVLFSFQLEDFSFDMTGRQALDILESDELKAFNEKHGDDMPILVEGRVGIIEVEDDGKSDPKNYIEQLQRAGATGAVVGGGLALDDTNILLGFS
jgi:indole-3-glycerol phosphate synthase